MATTLIINGLIHAVEVEPSTPLVFVLRNDLAHHGVKLGCGLEQCGACVVLADGVPTYACTRPVGELQGKQIETVEGLSNEQGQLHPLQQAFLDENAAQCGYCTSGILMRAKALLDNNPHPTRADICSALDDHLCRCGAQPRIIRAVARAAARMRGAP